MNRRAVFLDRDGTLIVDKGYIADPDQVELLPNVGERIKAILDAKWIPIVLTNQAGVGYGNLTVDQLGEVHNRMRDLIVAEGGDLFTVYWCPHRPQDECFCRKPKPGLFYRAAVDFQLDLRECLMIGNMLTDMQAAKAVNCHRYKVTGGLGDWDPRQLEKL